MINFKRLNKDVKEIEKYLSNNEVGFCDLSVGCRYMWRDDFVIDYAVVDETLIMKETGPFNENVYYYPIGKNVENALREIEKHCSENKEDLKFYYVDNAKAIILSNRYAYTNVYNDRAWNDYIYLAESFKTYSGKKLSGQRNHVNKFRKTYPNYSFKEIEEKDLSRIEEFLSVYNREINLSVWTEKEESEKVFDYIKESFNLGQVGGYIEVDGKIVALSVGEKVKDTLIVHVEKALKEYEGVYPTMASEFAKRFVTSEIKYINREEDCGDEGLRISKLQYHPIEIKEKNFVEVNTAISYIPTPFFLKTERLTVTDITESDIDEYNKIYLDEKLNKFWGYDYKEDLVGELKKDYFYNFSLKLKENKEEYDFAVKKNGKMIGELCLYNFDYYGTAEIGFRIIKEEQNKGYAKESVIALMNYAKKDLKIKKMLVRCCKENIPSKHFIESLGFKSESENKTQYFYSQIL